MDWKILGPLVLTSSVISAILTVVGNHFTTLWREGAVRKSKGDLSALLVAIALDQYASDCATTAGDNDTWTSSGGSAGDRHSNVPKAPTYPEEVDWQALGINLTTEALDFRMRVTEVYEGLSGLWDVDPQQAVDDTPENAIEIGREALTLSESIRKKRGIKARKPWNKEWNTKTFLDEQWTRIEAKRAKIEAGRKANPDEDDFLADLNAPDGA